MFVNTFPILLVSDFSRSSLYFGLVKRNPWYLHPRNSDFYVNDNRWAISFPVYLSLQLYQLLKSTHGTVKAWDVNRSLIKWTLVSQVSTLIKANLLNNTILERNRITEAVTDMYRNFSCISWSQNRKGTSEDRTNHRKLLLSQVPPLNRRVIATSGQKRRQK